VRVSVSAAHPVVPSVVPADWLPADLVVDGHVAGAEIASPSGLRVASAHSSAISARGALHITGAGASDCDIEVEGDLVTDGAIRSGRVTVAGTLRVGELAGREGARLRVILTATGDADEILCAAVVHAGVEISVAGQELRFDRCHRDVRIGIADGRAVVRTA
jgi:hypothetical protein